MRTERGSVNVVGSEKSECAPSHRRSCFVWGLLCGTILGGLLVMSCTPDPSAALSSEQAIRATYESYKKAVRAHDGVSAFDVLNAASQAHYQHLVEWIISASADDVQQLPLIERQSVLIARQCVGISELLELKTGRDLFALSVSRGWVNGDALSSFELGTIAITGNHATAPAVIGGEETGEQFRFDREGQEWRIDWTPTDEQRDLLRLSVEMSGMSETQYLFDLVAKLSGRPISDAIWQPIR